MLRLLIRISAGMGILCALFIGATIAAAQFVPRGDHLLTIVGWLNNQNGRSTSLLLIDMGRGIHMRLDHYLDGFLNPDHLAWSPDGRYAAFSAASLQTHDLDIYVLDFQTMRLHRQTTLGYITDYPAWSRDGEHMAFVSAFEGNAIIYAMPVLDDHTASPSILMPASRRLALQDLHWSPDGTSILFNDDVQLGIMRLDVNSGQTTVLIRDRFARSAHFSPDGRQISFISTSRATFTGGGLYIASSDGSDITQIPIPNYIFNTGSRPVWSPDSTAILFSAYPLDDANRASIYRADIATRGIGLLYNLPYSAFPISMDWRPR